MSDLAKTLRRTPTVAEVRFWRLIYPMRQNGWHFRKQAPIGRYVVDFVCHGARLIVEIDGDSHYSDAGIVQDATRTAFLRGEGYQMLRFTNDDVLQNADGVFEVVAATLETCSPAPSLPPPSRGR